MQLWETNRLWAGREVDHPEKELEASIISNNFYENKARPGTRSEGYIELKMIIV